MVLVALISVVAHMHIAFWSSVLRFSSSFSAKYMSVLGIFGNSSALSFSIVFFACWWRSAVWFWLHPTNHPANILGIHDSKSLSVSRITLLCLISSFTVSVSLFFFSVDKSDLKLFDNIGALFESALVKNFFGILLCFFVYIFTLDFECYGRILMWFLTDGNTKTEEFN